MWCCCRYYQCDFLRFEKRPVDTSMPNMEMKKKNFMVQKQKTKQM